jgi:hypothetical protein
MTPKKRGRPSKASSTISSLAQDFLTPQERLKFEGERFNNLDDFDNEVKLLMLLEEDVLKMVLSIDDESSRQSFKEEYYNKLRTNISGLKNIVKKFRKLKYFDGNFQNFRHIDLSVDEETDDETIAFQFNFRGKEVQRESVLECQEEANEEAA